MGFELYFAILFLLSAILDQSYAYRKGPQVNTTLGPIHGISRPLSPKFSKRNGTVNKYLGIPYAKPPVGERRFQPPEPLDPWEGAVIATDLPPFCPQVLDPLAQLLVPGLGISEDCLKLNVYVPSTAPPNAPVMVWIHGGGFNNYGGALFDAVPLSLIGDVIVVTINYRLNILGFFSTGDDAIPANLGLLDQQMALRWVNEHIAAFGGNPDMVTIFGESAGGASVGFHLLSAESRQFFQRAILQSGSPFNSWAIPIPIESAREAALVVAAAGDCLPDVPEDTVYIADCLRNKSVEELVELVGKVQAGSAVQGRAFGPVDDAEFFPSGFSTLIQEGNFGGVEVIVGSNKDEGTFATHVFSGYSLSRPFFSKEQFASLANLSDNPLVLGLLEAIYASGIDDTGNYLDALSEIFGDTAFTCGVIDFGKLVSAAGMKTYMYRLNLEPLVSLTGATWVGASHGEDLPLVFGIPFVSDTPVYDELKLSFYIIQMWTNFAKSGDPNLPITLPERVPEWPQFIPETGLYKELDATLLNNQRLREHQCNFWSNLYPEILTLQAIAASGTV